jgi:hypothetical protein
MREDIELSPSKPNAALRFAEFVARYEKTADVLANCPRPDWMLEFLKERGYCNCEKLEGFIDSLSMLIDDNNDEAREQARRDYFNCQPYVDQLEQEIVAGNLSQFEARRRRFISARITALESIRYIFEDKVDRFRFDKSLAQIMSEGTGIELSVTNVDEIEFKHTVLKEMADMLRQNIGNPFCLARPNDFYYEHVDGVNAFRCCSLGRI